MNNLSLVDILIISQIIETLTAAIKNMAASKRKMDIPGQTEHPIPVKTGQF
jgi:hypothetical protein